MAYEHFLNQPADYATFGMNPEGVYAGSTDGIGSGVGFEPTYFINAETDIGATTRIGWRSGDRAGAGALLEGDGLSGALRQITVEMKMKLLSTSMFGSGPAHIWTIGLNGSFNGGGGS